ncbi:hypothetical protein F4677DRAFT_414404 [Hypoxylon crocopeplum]|nr:hypothetical protein F4677DRAFT_414404 [Hypoxylon crocopeplum]
MDKSRAKEEKIQASPTTITVDSPAALVSMFESVHGLPTKPPSFFLDAQMYNGKAIFLSLFIPLQENLYRIKIDGRRGIDLSTPGPKGESLKTILESESIPKITFDVRPLSYALYRQHNISLDGIRDLQLMELASRDAKQSKKYVKGLVKCIEQDTDPSNEVRQRWLGTENVDEYHISNVLGHAPRSSMKRVEVFPTLWNVYYARLRRPAEAFWLAQSRWESQTRVAASQLPKFNINDKGNALGPEVWYDHEQRKYAMDNWNEDQTIGIRIGG